MSRNTVRTFDSHNPTNWRYYDIAQKPRQHSERRTLGFIFLALLLAPAGVLLWAVIKWVVR